VHELNVVGETDTIKLSIQNGSSFSATTGVTVDSKAVVELDQGNLISAQVQVQPGGVLAGNGTVTGNVVVGATSGEVEATLRPGLSVGQLHIQGNYEQGTGGTMAIEIDGTEAGQFDTISVSGGAKLGGMLVVDATEFGTLTPGTTFPILSAGDLAAGATFEDVLTVGNNDIYFAPTYVPGSSAPNGLAAGSDLACSAGVMCVTGYFKGDMNRNGMYDAADIQSFALALTKPPEYHSAFGLFGTAPGDLDGWGTPGFSPNGRLDFDDIRGFRALMASQGVPTAGLAAAIAALQGEVPEPSALVLLLGTGIIAVLVRRQRSAHFEMSRLFCWGTCEHVK
jgi:hypothetical protein